MQRMPDRFSVIGYIIIISIAVVKMDMKIKVVNKKVPFQGLLFTPVYYRDFAVRSYVLRTR